MSTSQLHSTCMEHRILSIFRGFAGNTDFTYLTVFLHNFTRKWGMDSVKMGYDIYLTMYNREFHTVNA